MSNVMRASFPDVEGAYLLVSGSIKNEELEISQLNTRAMVSFLLVEGDIAIEWEPNYGPIQIFYRAGLNDPDRIPHYVFPFVKKPGFGEWSQLAVEQEGLPQAFIAGNYKYIFDVLAEWI